MNRTGFLVGVVVLCVVGSGCHMLLQQVNKQPVKVEMKMLSEEPAPVAPLATPEEIISYESVRELPVGFFFYQTQKVKKLHAYPGYPTAVESHRIIAAFGWTGGGGYYGVDIPDEVRQKASAAGANGLFRPNRKARYCYAIFVSLAPPDVASAGSRIAERA